jgi:hypothetical protein
MPKDAGRIPRIAEFFRRESKIFAVGLFIGVAYQIYYYTFRGGYRGLKPFPVEEFFSLEGIQALTMYFVGWLIMWRVALGLLRTIGTRVSEFVKALGKFQDRVFDTTESAPAVRIVVHGLRRRARLATLAANVSLVLIVVSLLGGLFIFRSAESSAAAGQVEGAIRYRESELESLAQESSRLREELAKAVAAAEAKIATNTKPSYDVIDDIKQRISHSQKQMDDARAGMRSLSDSALHPDRTYLWSVLSTKIGSSFLILFLAQILITLYRYSTRVAAFYEARADALQIASEVDGLSLKDLVDALSADKVDFGKAPVPPSQMIFDTLKSALEKATQVGVEAARKVRP